MLCNNGVDALNWRAKEVTFRVNKQFPCKRPRALYASERRRARERLISRLLPNAYGGRAPVLYMSRRIITSAASAIVEQASMRLSVAAKCVMHYPVIWAVSATPEARH